MNKRIRELAEQARCFTETYDNELLSEPALLYCFHEDDFEKFAELIVREAMTVTKDYTCNQGWDYSAPVALARHFGVGK